MSRRSLVPSIFSLRRASHLSLLHRRWLGNGWLGNQWNGDFNAHIMEIMGNIWDIYGKYRIYGIDMGNLWEIYGKSMDFQGTLWLPEDKSTGVEVVQLEVHKKGEVFAQFQGYEVDEQWPASDFAFPVTLMPGSPPADLSDNTTSSTWAENTSH